MEEIRYERGWGGKDYIEWRKYVRMEEGGENEENGRTTGE